MSAAVPTPLQGDRQKNYRIQIVGNSGSGKTTLGKRMALVLNLPHLSLDEVFWRPGWAKTPPQEFVAAVKEFMEKAEREHGGWVIDGAWGSLLKDYVEMGTTDIIWLDPPLALYLPRLVLRTFLRLLRVREPCSPGCGEKWNEVFFSRDSIIWWCITHHPVVRERGEKAFAQGKAAGVSVARDAGGEVVGKRRRIGGWGSEYTAWWEAVVLLVKAE